MPFCGASKTKTPSAQQVKKTAQNASRDIPLQNTAAPVNNQANEAATKAAVDQQIAQYKAESAAKHEQEVAQWEKKFDEKITEVKTKQSHKHTEELDTIEQQHVQERSHHQSEMEALQAEIAALQREKAEVKPIIASESNTRALSVHNSYIAPAPVETIVTRHESAPRALPVYESHVAPVQTYTETVVPTTTSVAPLGTYTSTTVPYPVSTHHYENTTIPTGEGLPDSRVTYTVISDATTTAVPTTYTESAPRVTTSEYVTRSVEPVTHTYVTETAPRVNHYENTIIPTGEGLPDTRVTYTVISDATTTAVPTEHVTTSEYVTRSVEPVHTYTEIAPRVTTSEYVTRSVEPVTQTYTTAAPEYTYTSAAPVVETSGDYHLVNGNYSYTGSTTTAVPVTTQYTTTSVPVTTTNAVDEY